MKEEVIVKKVNGLTTFSVDGHVFNRDNMPDAWHHDGSYATQAGMCHGEDSEEYKDMITGQILWNYLLYKDDLCKQVYLEMSEDRAREFAGYIGQRRLAVDKIFALHNESR